MDKLCVKSFQNDLDITGSCGTQYMPNQNFMKDPNHHKLRYLPPVSTNCVAIED